MKSVVILFSDKRSGSTMFQRELCCHPGVSHVEYTPHSNFETHHWLKGAVMLGLPESGFAGGIRYRGYGTAANAQTYLLDCIRGNIPQYRTDARGKELVFGTWDALCEHYAQPVFFEKSPQHLAHWTCIELFLEWMATTTLTVKVIGLIRNPMAVMYSAQKQFHTDPSVRQHGWLEIQQNLLNLQSRLSSDSFMLCRYEDIVAKPGDAFRELTDFIGLAPEPACGAGVNVRPDLWREDRDFTLELDEEVARMAQRFGYTGENLYNPNGSPINAARPRLAGRLRLLPNRLLDRVIKPLRIGQKNRE